MSHRNRLFCLFCVSLTLASCGNFLGGGGSASDSGALGSGEQGVGTPETGTIPQISAGTLQNGANANQATPDVTPNAPLGGNTNVTAQAPTSGGNATAPAGNANGLAAAPSALKVPNFAFGAIIDYDGLGAHGKQSVQSFVAATQVVPWVVDSYVQLKADGTFELAIAKTLVDQAAAAGVPSVCLSVTSQVQGPFSAAQLASLVSSVSYGRQKGVSMEIRFGYEMNGDWSPSNKTGTQTYAPANFLAQWAQVAPPVQAAGGKMFWSPNIPFNSGSALANWLPKDIATIDMVGLDYYPKTNPLTTTAVRGALDTIYDLAKKLNKPVYFGESAYASTGTSYQENSSEAQSKIVWLAALTDAQIRADYPLYRGLRWFDYQKYENTTYNNFALSADPVAAAAFKAWYPTSAFAQAAN